MLCSENARLTTILHSYRRRERDLGMGNSGFDAQGLKYHKIVGNTILLLRAVYSMLDNER